MNLRSLEIGGHARDQGHAADRLHAADELVCLDDRRAFGADDADGRGRLCSVAPVPRTVNCHRQCKSIQYRLRRQGVFSMFALSPLRLRPPPRSGMSGYAVFHGRLERQKMAGNVKFRTGKAAGPGMARNDARRQEMPCLQRHPFLEAKLTRRACETLRQEIGIRSGAGRSGHGNGYRSAGHPAFRGSGSAHGVHGRGNAPQARLRTCTRNSCGRRSST